MDGEIVIQRGGSLDFDALQMRLHPAESRIRKLSAEIPAEFVCFDVLLWNKKALHKLPLEERRAQVEKPFAISPASRDTKQAEKWLDRLDVAGFDGVIAKRLGLPYMPGSRERVLKVKQRKTADAVVVGVTWSEKGGNFASLLLGLYDDEGQIRHVGAASAGARGRREEIEERVKPLLGGEPSRMPRGAEPLAAEGRARVERSSPSSSSRSSTTSGRASAFATAPASFASAPTRIRRTAPSSRCAGSRSAATLLLRGF